MGTQTVLCPSCKTRLKVQGNPGEKIYITCPQCFIKGTFLFPQDVVKTRTAVTAIETKNLTKFYGKHKGVENLTFSVKKGEIFGFLGPNGSGKTTTIRTLLGFLRPTSGEAYIFGRSVRDDIVEIKKNIGYIPGDLNLYGHLTGEQFLDYCMSLRDSNATLLDELLQIFEIPSERIIKEYSKGMKQKLGIIQAFMHDPEIVIMDEPTSGLDPLLQQSFYEFLKKEKTKGRTIFFSSHILSEIDKICDRVAIIRDGSLVALEDIETLKRKQGKIINVKIKENPETFPGPEGMTIQDDWLRFIVSDNIDQWIKKLAKFTIVDLEISEFNLEDIFIHYYEE